MLNPEEQAEILRLARKLATQTQAMRAKAKSGTVSPRSANHSIEQAEERLREYLKEAG